jgi:hypothetical protein
MNVSDETVRSIAECYKSDRFGKGSRASTRRTVYRGGRGKTRTQMVLVEAGLSPASWIERLAPR